MADVVALRRALQEERARELEARVLDLLAPFTGTEVALDAGCGLGALAFALAPHVREVVGIDTATELLNAARERAPENVRLLEGDVEHLPFEPGSFDLAGCTRVLHHTRRPELVVAELVRVVRPGCRILLMDQLGPTDPMQAFALDRFERAREPSHRRFLSDADVRGSLEANDLVVLANTITRERRDLEHQLDLAGVPEAERPAVRGLAPSPAYDVDVGWYVARTPGFSTP